MTRRIDLHAHVLTPGYEATLTRRSFPPQTVGQLSTFMERSQINAAVVSMGGALEARTVEAARLGNEELAGIVRDAPGQFGAVAIVPFTATDPEVAVEAIAYALDTLGLDGVGLFSNHDGCYLGEPAWDTVLAELDRRAAYVFVHPAAPAAGLALPRYPAWLFEYPFDTTRALANLIHGGALGRYPNIRFQFAHLGGSALFLAHRLASLAARDPDRTDLTPAAALDFLRRQFYDTALSNNTAALATTLAVTTVDRVVFGSDWPYLAERDGGDPTEDFELLDPATRAKIDALNAAALVPRLASVREP
jgi:6-methylsalicylate decarboxylase